MSKEGSEDAFVRFRRTVFGHALFGDKARRRADQFVEVGDAILAFLLAAVMFFQCGQFDHMVDLFGQRQMAAAFLHLRDQLRKAPQHRAGLAGQQRNRRMQAAVVLTRRIGKLLQ